ncbi:hypothetical protein J6590_035519 [Homalodisca vitripennis]|nr:hypothetical protein J6590_035519 [Homalodisca vitripennis]
MNMNKIDHHRHLALSLFPRDIIRTTERVAGKRLLYKVIDKEGSRDEEGGMDIRSVRVFKANDWRYSTALW